MDTLFADAEGELDTIDNDGGADEVKSAIPLAREDRQPILNDPVLVLPVDSTRALALTDIVAPAAGPGERLIRLAYRLGVPGSTLVSPFRKPTRSRLLATVESPLLGDRAAGVALRAGHFLVHGVKTPIGQMDFESSSRLSPPFERVIHGFSWLRDLGSSAPREQCIATAERICSAWLAENSKPGKGAAWTAEYAGQRLLAWLVNGPLVLSGQDAKLKPRLLDAIDATARWLDRNVAKSSDQLGQVAGWCAIAAAGLLLPDGKPRRLYGEAGLIRSLGELVAEDGGVLSRSPLAQMDAIALLVDLRACYQAVDRQMPSALGVMLELLVPPLLTIRHGDGGLGSWQGSSATSADRLSALIEASGVRTRPLKDVREWGFQRLGGGQTTVLMDAAPPPKPRHARWGCASTLAFEMSEGAHRLIVNCGGSALAGGQVPARIEQGLRATAAHSTLVLDNVNSTAVLLHGQLGKGVEQVEVERRVMKQQGGEATRVEASHDGYAARFGLTHNRILMLRADGEELRGEDLLVPKNQKGKRGKIDFAIRFHLGPRVEARLAEDRRGASLLLPNGSLWQFRMGGDDGTARVALEESLWVDGEGRPHPIQQVVIQGMAQRSGGQFSWLLKKMG
ncbi:heparinase II/III family protein [Altererythrobacter arenosus]|uniref:Heparinase II/III family protein n=1 Tax=Altererythrobacter arenosus TaxID=3032592 RepID=A0ABY8FZ18_9SPHN|nr:heparinase II/III family protein [Altererythrobacter sp. CAU 1644]WFL78546.1 heparinase II/III family protein [Altererythrobacter sp. CAU 1644]